MPAVLRGDGLEGLEFPGRHLHGSAPTRLSISGRTGGCFWSWVMAYRTGADIPDLAALDNIVQRLHDLLPRRVPVQAMDLQYVDVCAQPLHAGVDRVQDMLPRQPDPVKPPPVVFGDGGDLGLRTGRVDAEVAFREQHDVLAGDGVFPESFADYLFRAAVGVDICLCYPVSVLPDTPDVQW